VVGLGSDLLGEIAMLEQAGRLDDAPQLMLAPTPRTWARAARPPAVSSRSAVPGDRTHRSHLLAQLRIRVDAVAFQLGDPLFVAAQRLVQRATDRATASCDCAVAS